MATVTNAQCSAFGNKIRDKVDEFFNPRIEATEKLILEQRAAEHDPTQYKIQGGIATVNLLLLLEKMKESKVEGMKQADVHESECDKGAVPDWIGDAQKVSDIALGIAMLPIIVLTGSLAAAQVDLGEVYKGKPLGGDNAFIPKMRNDILTELQISGDVEKFIKDPFNVTADFFVQGLEGLKDWLKKPFG